MKPVKVVIRNWNGRSHLERFLPVLVARTPGADIVVADNGSTDDSADFIRRGFRRLNCCCWIGITALPKDTTGPWPGSKPTTASCSIRTSR